MVKNRNNNNVTQEQLFLHKSFALMQLKNAFLSVKAIEGTCATCAEKTWVIQALIRDAVVQYGSIFKYSNIGEDQRHRLDISIIPKEFRELHTQLISYRDQLFAHFDFVMINPVKKDNNQGVYWHLDNKGPNDFIDKIIEIRTLVVHLMKQLSSNVDNEQQELSQNSK